MHIELATCQQINIKALNASLNCAEIQSLSAREIVSQLYLLLNVHTVLAPVHKHVRGVFLFLSLSVSVCVCVWIQHWNEQYFKSSLHISPNLIQNAAHSVAVILTMFLYIRCSRSFQFVKFLRTENVKCSPRCATIKWHSQIHTNEYGCCT